ncbi:MAG: Fur family transcriptional regulator [Pseudomonadota bacterium]
MADSHAHTCEQPKLTKNQTMVLNVLSKLDGPATAYGLLETLRDVGFKAPLQVYRALDKLIEQGLAHRLESLNAYVACARDCCAHHRSAAFMICNRCEHVSELPNEQLTGLIADMADSADFDLATSTVEMRGVCARCTQRASAKETPRTSARPRIRPIAE